MKKRIGRRLLSLLLTVVTVITLLPAMTLPALAVSGPVTGDLTDKTIGLSFDGDKDDTWIANGITISGRITGKSGIILGTRYHSTLTITNKKNTPAKLSFKYTVVVPSGGKVKVNGTEVTANDSFSGDLSANGGSIQVYIESPREAETTKITMTDVTLVSDTTATVTFQPAENGSYTVDKRDINESWSNTQSSLKAYQVDATPAAGYQFRDWYDVSHNKSISRVRNAKLNIEKDCTIKARFTTSGLALFETGGLVYDDLTNAITAARGKSSALITQVGDGTISGIYTIPSGVTLLIPFDEAGTLYKATPTATREKTPATKAFRTLTMAAGSSITLEKGAAISVGGQYYAGQGGQSGQMVGPYGYIKMESGSAITVKSGASLYAWGFISGSGAVTVENGGSVYEWYQILDFRGGFATSNIVTVLPKGVFPLSQYTVQNVEVPLTLCAGASETVYTAVYADGVIYPTAIQFIGNDGMFKLNSGSLTKTYDGSTDRLIYTINGDAEVNSLSLSLAGVELDSSKYVLPFTNNMTVVLKSGSKLTMNQTAALLPSVSATIERDAELVVPTGKNMFIYDMEQWGNYCFGSKGYVAYVSVPYAPGKTGTRAPLTDAKMDINGTLTAIGSVYTTDSGANICSSEGSGKFVQKNTPGTETKTYQVTKQASKKSPFTEYAKITITPAKLKNAAGADKPYTETSTAKAGETFTYCTCPDCGGKWTNGLQVAEIVKNDGTQGNTYETLQKAVDNLKADQYIKLLHNTTEKPISVNNKSLYLDLNGRTVTGDISVTGNHKLYGMDSSAKADYTTAPTGKIVGTVKGYAPTYQTPGDTYDCYVAIPGTEADNETANLSFHRFNISVTGYRFELTTGDTPQCALFFIGKFQGDDAAKKYLTSLGFTLKDDNDTQLGKADYEFTADTVIPEMPADGKESTSEVVRSGDAFLFEVYLKRSFDKAKPDGYTKKISATAQATFKNNGTQDSEPKLWSFEDAWKNPGELDETQQEILDNFLQKLGITKQAE
jgi:hypothetical protein